MFASIELIGYGLCAAAFAATMAAVALAVLCRRLRVPAPSLLLAALGLTTLWAAAIALSAWDVRAPDWSLLELARTLAWQAYIFVLLGRLGDGSRHVLMAGAGLVGLVLAATDLWQGAPETVLTINHAAHVLMAVVGLLLLENLFRNSDADGRWAIKYLCFGLGSVFAYDFFLYSDAVLLRHIDGHLFAARGFTDALAVPLAAIGLRRAKSWPLRLSRRLVLHTAALLGSGIYLLIMSGVALSLRELGEAWGPVVQAIFLTGAGVLLVTLFSSGSARSRVRILLVRHLFRERYDYRVEWLRFIRRLSGNEPEADLAYRVVRAVADILDCPSGGLWLLDEEGGYLPAAAWNFGQGLPAERADGGLARLLAKHQGILDLDVWKADPGRVSAMPMPAWLATHPRAWLVLPMMHREHLLAFLVLGRPRAPRDLDWEDDDLLATI
ncbi:MAG: PEP-CTERM system histidine kinase PrsK, partial [Rhodospirillales bacterium]|nr:PEP-CTERM system histidine kinase PrsK [Rhodospirillales bacterium]